MSTPTLPEWYLDTIAAVPPEGAHIRRRPGLFVRRALSSLAEALVSEMSSSPRADSWLSRIEPRAKVLGVFGLIFGMTFLHGLVPLAMMLAGAVALVLSARIGVGRLGRVWLGVPLFSLAIILPAATNLVTPGEPLAILWRFGDGARLGPWSLPDALAITGSGLIVAMRFLLRSLDAVTLAFALVASTEHSALLDGLRRLAMPRAFGMVLAMSQRYLAVLLRAAEEIHLAKLSRTISAGPLRHEQRWVAAGIGSLFRRTHRLAQEVHNAMVSRGFDGEVWVAGRSRMRLTDGLWLACVSAVMAGLILCDRWMY